MPGGLTLVAGSLAVAGLVAAVGPLLIHLLNRRRYRVVDWAAMDFLRQALGRSRRWIKLRDMLLLILRTVCLLLFGLAMARPYWSTGPSALNSAGPVHAVLIVDNSLSMGYARLDGTLLDVAKTKAREFIDQLPTGSRCTVLPLCGGERVFLLAPAATLDDARAVLMSIEVVDRGANGAMAIELAREACRQVDHPATKRVVFLGDQQAVNWPDNLAAIGDGLPGLQVVHVPADSADNTWVEEVTVRDRPVDSRTLTSITSMIRHQGATRRTDVQVSLSVDGRAIASQSIDLEPGQAREVHFDHRFDASPGQGLEHQAIVEVTLPADRLPDDDRRLLAVPVVSSLPVLFVDQFGESENPTTNRHGETYRLRRLLAPRQSRNESSETWIEVRQATIDGVSAESLSDVRLVVVAGVEQPGAAVEILREFVFQGGRLLIAAGGDFDPLRWNEEAWLDGAGILPCPLGSQFLGRLPESVAGSWQPLGLDTASLAPEFFLLPNVDGQELSDLYRLPYFFRAIEVSTQPSDVEALLAAETARIERHREAFAAVEASLAAWDRAETAGTLSEAQFGEREAQFAERRRLAPDWLAWSPRVAMTDELDPLAQAKAELPRILARYDSGAPFLVERSIGRGQVLLMTTGLDAQWNTLTTTNAVLLLDRICRVLIDRTLPDRNPSTSDRFTLPIAAGERGLEYTLRRPGSDIAEPLTIEALSGERVGLTVRDLTRRGVYSIDGREPTSDDRSGQAAASWRASLVANGPAGESDLTPLDEDSWRSRVGDAPWVWIEPDATPSVDGGSVLGRDLWKWPMAVVLLLLLVELTALACTGRNLEQQDARPAELIGGRPK